MGMYNFYHGREMRYVTCELCGRRMHRYRNEYGYWDEETYYCPRCINEDEDVLEELYKESEKRILGEPISVKNKTVALLLCLFLGCWGAHRFYAGKIGTGILFIFTLGFCEIGTIIDLITIATGIFKDSKGYPIKK